MEATDFLDLVRKRQSTRVFDTTKLVEKDKIDRIIEAGRLSPSACNAQPWHFIVVDEPELKNKVADATSTKALGINHFTKQAPIHIVIVEEKSNIASSLGGMVKNKSYSPIDIGIATAHITLASESEGLGSCIIGWFDEKKIQQLLNIPRNKRVILDIIIGYPAQPLREKKRKSTKEICSYNTYKT